MSLVGHAIGRQRDAVAPPRTLLWQPTLDCLFQVKIASHQEWCGSLPLQSLG